MNCVTSGAMSGAALAQRRDDQRDPLDAIEEIRAEAPGASPPPRAAGASRRRAAASTSIFVVPPTRMNLPVLEEAQELRLHGERHLADLVEEQRAAVGGLELAARALVWRR